MSSSVKVASPSFEWKIENFSQLNQKSGEYVESPEFECAQARGRKWCLQLYTYGRSLEEMDTVSLFLRLKKSSSSSGGGGSHHQDSVSVGPDVYAEYQFSVINTEGRVLCNKSSDTFEKFSDSTNIWGFRDLGISSCLDLIEDILLVRCYITVVDGHPNTNDESYKSVSQLMGKLFNEQKTGDVKFRCAAGGHTYRAHRAIIGLRSPRLLESGAGAEAGSQPVRMEEDTSEGTGAAAGGTTSTTPAGAAPVPGGTTPGEAADPDVVEIAEFHSDVIKELLFYLYTNKVRNLHVIGKELLIAADKFGIEDLKYICGQYLSRNVSASNVADMLTFSTTYNNPALKKNCLQVIRNNATSVIKTDGWKSLIESNPLLGEVCEVLVMENADLQSRLKRRR